MKKRVWHIVKSIFPLILFLVISASLYLYITKDGLKSTVKTIKVQVEGAVISPGIKELKDGSITEDAIAAATGYQQDKYDKEYVDQKINLAKKLKDGDKVFIPFKKEDALSTPETISKTGKININKADAKQLDSLSGVGETTAKKIIEGRPYTKITDLLDKKIVNKSTYSKIESQIEI